MSITVTDTNTSVTVTEVGQTVTITEGIIGVVTAYSPGPQGAQGEPGEGLLVGGTTGQVLAKVSNDDLDTEWKTLDLESLSDVDLTTSKDGELLEYDGVAGQWKNKAADKNPVYTYSGGNLTRIDYSNGNYKTFSYTGAQLTQVVYTLAGRTITKTFTYNLDGTLASITQTETYI